MDYPGQYSPRCKRKDSVVDLQLHEVENTYKPKSNFPRRLSSTTINEDFDILEKIGRELQMISHSAQQGHNQNLNYMMGKFEWLHDTIADKYNVQPKFSRKQQPDIAMRLHSSETDTLFNKHKNTKIIWSTEKESPSSPLSPTSTQSSFFLGSKNRVRKKSTKFPQRAVLKNGECNVLQKNRIGDSRLRFLQDIFTTLVDVQWRWTLLIFSLSFIGSWTFYAGIYWLIAFSHGDFDPENRPSNPCIVAVDGFTTAFLFSVETQHTIGYGGRSTTEECPEAIFIMCMQSITGVMISAFMAGIFFAKMARPKQRRQTLLFSKRAVICQRDGKLCLMFRVGDMRKSHIIGTSIRAHIFRNRITREGEHLQQYQGELSVTADGCESDLLFLWPLTVVHVIDKDSPLYCISAQEFLCEKFEIVAVLEGTVESTGQTTQARSSYIPSEIKWGHRFENIVSYNEDRQGYEIDYKKFNDTIKVATPLCSARDLEELYQIHSELLEYNPNNNLLPDSA